MKLVMKLVVIPGVGEFVVHGQTVLRVQGDGQVDEGALRDAVSAADERTIEQDPEFALRIIVDTAIRALSPAVNDPTTAVQGIDALEVIVRELAVRDLEAPFASDANGTVRVRWRAPNWGDLLDLAFDEIRAYGGSSVQVCRRLRAALEDLRRSTPELRHRLIDEHRGGTRGDDRAQLSHELAGPAARTRKRPHGPRAHPSLIAAVPSRHAFVAYAAAWEPLPTMARRASQRPSPAPSTSADLSERCPSE